MTLTHEPGPRGEKRAASAVHPMVMPPSTTTVWPVT